MIRAPQASAPPRSQRPLLHQIGNTPLVAVPVGPCRERCAELKLEAHNLSGSVKARTALGLIQHLEEGRILHPGSTLIESSSGNNGKALAAIGSMLGYEVEIYVDPNTTAENLDALRDLGARVSVVTEIDETGGYLRSRLRRIEARLKESPQCVWANQYSSLGNPRAHFFTTGPEILRQTDGEADLVVVAVSTGGTAKGLRQYFQLAKPELRLLVVDVPGSSAVLGDPGPRSLPGIGAGRRSEFLSSGDYDAVAMVPESHAVATCLRLAGAEGVEVGASSGAAFAACEAYLQSHPEIRRPVVLCPDGGRAYASTVFNEEWRVKRHLTAEAAHSEAIRFHFPLHHHS